MIIKSEITGKEYSSENVLDAIRQCKAEDAKHLETLAQNKKAENEIRHDRDECIKYLKEYKEAYDKYLGVLESIRNETRSLTECAIAVESARNKRNAVLIEFSHKYGTTFVVESKDGVDASELITTRIDNQTNGEISKSNTYTKKFSDDLSDMKKSDIDTILKSLISKF